MTLFSSLHPLGPNQTHSPNFRSAAKKEAIAFIESQWEFMSSGSLEVAQKMFSKDAILIGTDKAEPYYGWEEMKASIEAQLALETPKISSRNRNIIISEGVNMAAYTELIDFSFEMNGEAMSIKDVRSSGVIQKIDGEWKIVQVHTSIGSEEQVWNTSRDFWLSLSQEK